MLTSSRKPEREGEDLKPKKKKEHQKKEKNKKGKERENPPKKRGMKERKEMRWRTLKRKIKGIK